MAQPLTQAPLVSAAGAGAPGRGSAGEASNLNLNLDLNLLMEFTFRTSTHKMPSRRNLGPAGPGSEH